MLASEPDFLERARIVTYLFLEEKIPDLNLAKAWLKMLQECRKYGWVDERESTEIISNLLEGIALYMIRDGSRLSSAT